MPSVNWDAFGKLPGSAQHNFEMLCRALIRRHFGRLGQFAALANQPGVEFHLKLHADCVLGSTGEWLGWQCRWFGLASGQALGTTRRKKIEHALATTEKMLPGLSRWILWCHRALQNQPLAGISKSASLRLFFHIRFLDTSKGLFNFFTPVSVTFVSVLKDLSARTAPTGFDSGDLLGGVMVDCYCSTMPR